MARAFIFLVTMAPALSLLSACDTVPIVKSDLAWNGGRPDQACVRKAIESTPGVMFERQNARCAGSERTKPADCEKRIFETFYAVTGNKDLKHAYVQLTRDEGGNISVTNQNVSALGAEFTAEDREGFRVAIRAVNESIKRFCPGAGAVSEPR